MIKDRSNYQPLVLTLKNKTGLTADKEELTYYSIIPEDEELTAPDQIFAQTLYQKTTPLKERSIKVVDHWDKRLDKAITCNFLQTKLDDLGLYIESKFKKFVDFNAWLDKKGFDKWYKDLAFYLIKLPAKVAFNIINLLYNIIKAICYTLTHPLKTPFKIAKLLIELAHALTRPEVWTKIGAGIMGAALGQALFVLNPMATLIGLIIGSAMVFTGLSFGVLEAALIAEKSKRGNKMKECLILHGKQLIEGGLTGFALGIITGAIQKTFEPETDQWQRTETKNEADNDWYFW